MTRHRRSRLDRSDESGVVLVLMALAMVAILTIVAIVIDLGQLRADRRDDQKNSDLAALAAGYYMSGHGSGSGGAVANPRAACKAALESVKTNLPDFPSSAGLDCSALPVNATTCETWSPPPMPMITLTSTGSSPYVLTVKYPVPATELTDPRFSGPGADDGTDQCARMLVDLGGTRDTYFANIVGVGSQSISARSVVKTNLQSHSKNVAALLLLERSNCEVLNAGGQGTVIVQSPSNLNPGRIQADSEGKGTCTTNDNERGYVVYAAGSGNSRIEVQPTADGKPGIIGIYSLTAGVDGRGGHQFTSATATNGLSVQPVAGDISSRKPVDEKYNPSTRTAITSLHARAWSAVTSAQPLTATLVSGAQCAAPPDSIVGTLVYVDCDDFVAGAATVFTDAESVYFTGKVTVANNMSLSFPVIEHLYIRGCRGPSTNCQNNETGNSAYALSVSGEGTLLVNTSAYAECPATNPPPPTVPPAPPAATLTHRIAEIATLGGRVSLTSGSRVAICQAVLYAGRGASTYQVQQRTSGAPNCDADLPCPEAGTGAAGALTAWVDEGYLDQPSGGGSNPVYWSAPNRSSGPPTASDPFEDLALWGESSRASFLKGTGSSRVSGVFFLPNSFVTLLGQGASNQPLNAQFISRGLSISGQGTVVLKPNPADAVETKSPGGYSLIR